MKKMMKTITLILIAGALISLTAGCSLFGGVSKTDRVTQFVATLNKGDDISEHIHPQCGDYNASKNSDFITDGSMLDTGANGSVKVSGITETFTGATGKWTNDNLDDADFTMVMTEDGLGVWKIMSLTVDGDTLID